MVRRIGFCFFALLLLAACQTTRVSAPPVRPEAPTSARDPWTMHAYDAARARLHAELLLCESALPYNTGPVGSRREATLYTPYILAPSGALLRNPTDMACLSSGFGWRPWAGGGQGRQHYGIDLANPTGGFVYAAGDGQIVSVGLRGGYGNIVEIDHGAGVHTLYGHLAEINPRLYAGSRVAGGSAIGRMGMTGNATGVHLHYEVIVSGIRVDPLTYGAQAPPIS